MFTHVLGDFGGTVFTKGTIVSPPSTPDLYHAWIIETDSAGLRAYTVAANYPETWITLDTGA